DVRRRAHDRGARRAEGPQGIEPRSVRRPQLGEVQPERPGASVDDSLELGDGLSVQPTLEAEDPGAQFRSTRDVEGHEYATSCFPRVSLMGQEYRKKGAPDHGNRGGVAF